MNIQRRRGGLWLAVLLVAALLPSFRPARADTFVLTSGGQVEGELLNPDESPREKFVIRTENGEITLPKAQVKQILRPRPEEVEYQRIRHDYPDTVEGQWALSEWCREHKLAEIRKTVLEHLLELDPEHAQTRALLGYKKVDGEWKTHAQAMTDNGFVEYKGRWRTPQEVEMLKEKDERAQAEKGWYSTIRIWRGWLDGPKHEEAQKNFESLRDANAIPAIAQILTNETSEPVKVLLIDTLYAMDNPAGDDLIAQGALGDASSEARLTCLDYVSNRPTPELVRFFVQQLKAKDNVVVNRAAVALGRMKDPSAITPLIDALVTKHKFMLVTGSPGSTTATQGSGGTGFSTGGGPKIIEQAMQNPAALDALVTLAGPGVNYGYDVASWKKWLITNRPARGLDARRD